MFDFKDIVLIVLYIFFALFIFIKYKKNPVGILSIMWMAIECGRQIFHVVVIHNIDNIEKTNLMNYFRENEIILKVIDTISSFLLIALIVVVIIKIRKEKRLNRQKDRQDEIIKEARGKNIIK